MSRDVTKPTKWVCTQRRLGWASAQSDQSLLSAWRKLGSSATHWVHIEDSWQTGQMPRLIRILPGCTLILLVLSCHGSNYMYITECCSKDTQLYCYISIKPTQVKRESITNTNSNGSGEPAHLRSVTWAFFVCTHHVKKASDKEAHLWPY